MRSKVGSEHDAQCREQATEGQSERAEKDMQSS